MRLGLDIGTSSTKAVLVDEDLRPQAFAESRNFGDPARALRDVIERLLEGRSLRGLRVGVTGAGRDILGETPGIFFANEVVALALGAARSHPEGRSIIEIGAQAARWVLLEEPAAGSSEPVILDFALNEVCAAGSGAFLEQQASRLKLGIEEFAALAASAPKGAAIAGRCSVFAKTDMIHLQQKGTPLEEIAYGLCQALVRNFAASVLKGRTLTPPLLLAGGGAFNGGLVNAFREMLDLPGERLILAARPNMLGALGAAAGAAAGGAVPLEDAAEFLFERIRRPQGRPGSLLPPLGRLDQRPAVEPSSPEFVEAYLGVDIGSVSTNLVLYDGDGRVRAGVYLPTRGRPIEVLREGFRILGERCPNGFGILGIGTTGSGRHLAGALLGADVVHNEITCQLRSAVRYIPDVETVFEIGGQDSKFINARGGRIMDFTMNKICAAGTGSFLEEQAGILGIAIEDEFSRLAALSAAPHDLGSRCTVFMETELSDALARGVKVEDIAAGLAFSIVRNYLEKVVAGRPLGKKIVFQGGVASNPAVVRAFALETGREVSVHPFNRISGAIGAAILAREEVEAHGKVSPAAAEVAERLEEVPAVTSFTCSHCSNRCQVNRIAFAAGTAFFGDACERYTSGQVTRSSRAPLGKETPNPVPDLFGERDALLEGAVRNPSNPSFRVGLPRASIFLEALPFWAGFFNALGGEVVLSPGSSAEILAAGLGKLPAETCLPVKIALGHIEWFRGRGVDGVFFPSVIDLHGDPEESQSLCPYSEHLPFMVRASSGLRIIAPVVRLGGRPEEFLRSVSELGAAFGKPPAELRAAAEAAGASQRSFRQTLEGRGREVLKEAASRGRPVWIVLGRPYTLHDPFLNLNLGRHIAKLGVAAVPIDHLPLDGPAGTGPGAPHWRYPRQVLRALAWAEDRPSIRPVILTNFGCGVDAFAMRHIEDAAAGRPQLVLEFDEHRAEAGLITRLEAFHDEVREGADVLVRQPKPALRPRPGGRFERYRSSRFVVPYFADHAHAFTGAMRGVGLEATLLALPDGKTRALGEQHTSGKECHAFSLIAGDFLKFAAGPRRGGEVFYIPGSKYSCLLSQYDSALNYLAADLGIDDLEALAPTADFLNQVLTLRGMRLLWQGLVAIDLLIRASCAIRPYEVRGGETDAAHRANLADIEGGLAGAGIGPALKRCAERLSAVEARRERRPVVGITGDVYTRVNQAANHDLFRKVEELGCEVRPSSFFIDEVDYDLGQGLRKRVVGRQYGASSVLALLYLRKEVEKIRIRRGLGLDVLVRPDPKFADVVRFGSPYVGLENNRMLLLSVAKMAEFADQGADGVINAICFNCMMGTVSAAISAKVRRDYGEIPIPTFIYTGTEMASEKTKLEAFVYQVRQNARRKGRRPSGNLEQKRRAVV